MILGDHVTTDGGTGLVHTAPDHGLDDFIVGQKYNLPMAGLVSNDGKFISTTEFFAGKGVFEANPLVVEKLQEVGNLLKVEKIKHSYPHCWRHKTPIIFRATPQWFIGMETQGLRQQALGEIKGVRWIPDWGKHVSRKWLKTAQTGVFLVNVLGAVQENDLIRAQKKTEELHPRTLELLEEVAKRVEKAGIQAWWDLDEKELLGADAETYRKVPDTLDVWFDSGSTYSSVVANRPEFNGQDIDMYLEGSDQTPWLVYVFFNAFYGNRQQSTIQTSINSWFHRGWSRP